LGTSHVLQDPSLLASYERATFATSHRVLAVLRPGSVAETQQALVIASRRQVPIYPLSRGFNWGYGSRVPRQDAAVVLELSRLRRISGFDDELGTVTVQAGVSFAELAAFLRRRGRAWMLSVTGGSPDASVLANALERGVGFGVGGNRIETVCALEVALATGELVRTGFARYPRARAAAVQRLGLGPALDGLFAQSNLGVTTSATVWLTRRPRWAAWIDVRIPHRDLPAALSIYRALLGSGTLRGVIKINNGYAVAMSSIPPMAVDAGWAGTLPWAGRIHVGGDDRAELGARLGHIERSLRGRAALHVHRGRVRPFDEIEGPYAGVPSGVGLSVLSFGRAAQAADAPPEPSGVLFLCPAVPLRGAAVKEAVELLARAALDAEFLPYITLNIMDERVVHVVFGLFYDRAAAGADRRAMRAYRRAFAACIARGYYPYRLGLQSMGELPAFADDSAAVLARLRVALDPAGVLGRGLHEGRSRR
jgi:4-cresol dehydrogenase (hydroxylating)